MITYLAEPIIQTETTAGKTISYVYDRMNRLTKVDHDGTASDIVYTYDVNGYKATEQKGSEPVVTYAYDAIGQLTSRGPPNAMVTYEYTALGQISKMITATGRQVNYTYDAVGNMTTVNTPALGTVTYDHNNLNLTTKIAYPNGVEENSVYDNENRLTGTELIKNTTSLYKKTQNYSLNGNIAQRNDPGQAPSTPRLEDFTYDPHT